MSFAGAKGGGSSRRPKFLAPSTHFFCRARSLWISLSRTSFFSLRVADLFPGGVIASRNTPAVLVYDSSRPQSFRGPTRQRFKRRLIRPQVYSWREKFFPGTDRGWIGAIHFTTSLIARIAANRPFYVAPRRLVGAVSRVSKPARRTDLPAS